MASADRQLNSLGGLLFVFRARERCSSWKVTLIYGFRYLSRLFVGGGWQGGMLGTLAAPEILKGGVFREGL